MFLGTRELGTRSPQVRQHPLIQHPGQSKLEGYSYKNLGLFSFFCVPTLSHVFYTLDFTSSQQPLREV